MLMLLSMALLLCLVWSRGGDIVRFKLRGVWLGEFSAGRLLLMVLIFDV